MDRDFYIHSVRGTPSREREEKRRGERGREGGLEVEDWSFTFTKSIRDKLNFDVTTLRKEYQDNNLLKQKVKK